MKLSDRAAPVGPQASMRSHSVPMFEGRASRSHQRLAMWRLRLQAEIALLRYADRLKKVETVVQFVGFPRSGHSLVGSLIDAHPNAAVAHELDALGLFEKKLPTARILPLMLANTEEFSRHGRWWNGFNYEIDVQTNPNGDAPLKVIGDKKGDWAARWSARKPDLPTRFSAATRHKTKWVLVIRHPLDNVATLSLRQGGSYDRLRIDPPDGDFGVALKFAQDCGDIATEASDEMVDDFRALCSTVAQMKARLPAEDWHEVVYEDFVAEPQNGLAKLSAFLDLPADPDWVEASVQLVHEGGSSRNRVAWTKTQLAVIAEIITDYDFFSAYSNDE